MKSETITFVLITMINIGQAIIAAGVENTLHGLYLQYQQIVKTEECPYNYITHSDWSYSIV